MSKFINRFSTIAVSIATVVTLSGGAILPVANADAVSDLQAQIAALLAQINALQAQLNSASGGSSVVSSSVPASLLSSGDLTVGSTGAAVMDLQKFLNGNGYTVSTSGAGSAGNESSYFGSLTKAALGKWQAAMGISPAAGYFGPITRAKLSSIGSTSGSTGGSTGGVIVPTGAGVSVSLAANQPAASIAPGGASRIPFTKINITAGANAVTVNSITAERTGLAADAAIDSVMLLDENGNQLGLKKTLNSDHRVTVGEAITISAGQTRTLTIAATRAAVGGAYAGQTLAFSVVAINTANSEPVTGTLPIIGTTHTVNETLTIGSVTMSRGALDPGSSVTKEVGTTGYTFSSIKATAGSAERIYVKSIRWNQTGSAGSGDLANLKTYIDGVGYDVVVSADGKYYSTTLPDSGILVEKGGSKELSLKGDITGGSARTVDFDIAKRTDFFVVGETFGYGIIPPQTGTSDPTDDTAAFSNTEDPWYDAAQVTVSAGNVTVSAWTGVQAQNIAINLLNQPLAGFSVDVKGEAVSVASIKFGVKLTDASGTSVDPTDLTNITLVNSSGAVLAGPIDGSGTGVVSGSTNTYFTITFTDTITFPVGITNLTLKGKLGTDFANNDTVTASTTPSTQWTSATGQGTGTTITLAPTSVITGQAMTAKAGALSVSVSSQPTAKNVISGSSKYEFARYILDASASGEDLRIISLPVAYDTTGTASDLTNCQLYDGTAVDAASLTTGSNVKNPTAVSSSTSMVFDGNGLTLTRGASKTLSLRCNLSASATATNWYMWGVDSGQNTDFTGVTGLTSGQTVTETFVDAVGQKMAAAAEGSYTVASDSSLLYSIAQAGTTVTLATFKFTASNDEDLTLKQIALALNNTASNSPADFDNQQVTLWNGTTQIGSAQFGGSQADFATSTLSGVLIPRGETVSITVKASLVAHNADQGTPGAFPSISYDGNNNGLTGNYAIGVSSGATVDGGTTSDVTTNGLRVYRTIPTFADITTNTKLVAGTDLYALSITAGSGRDVGIYQLKFAIATVTAKCTDFQLYGPAGALNATAVSQTGTDGSGIITIAFDADAVDRIIPAGTSKTYRLRANTISGLTSSGTESLSLYLKADTLHNINATSTNLMGTVLSALGGGGALPTGASTNIIWTPFSTTTSSAAAAAQANLDWTTSYGAPGFPAVGQNMPVRVFSD